MARRTREIVGKPIVSAATGQKLGAVADLLLDESCHSVVGLVVRDGWMAAERVLPYDDVQTIGPDAVIARSAGELIDRRRWRERAVPAARASRFTGRRVVTEGGRILGIVSELLIDERTGRVDGYRIAGRKGPLAPHSLLTQVEDLRVGPDAIVVRDHGSNAGGESVTEGESVTG
jgi:uncharacterized protein YrrD